MAISGQHKFNIDQSDDNSEYKAALHRDALYLIVAGHQRLIAGNDDYSDTAEEDITGELTKYTNEYISSLSSPNWTSHFYVQEELRENTNGKKGKNRPRVDIVCILTGRKPQEFLRFEAKRLRKPGFTVGKYLGKEGLGEFIAGNYAAGDDTAGMLGYVQSDDCDYWARKISDDMRKKKNEVGLIKGGQWQKANLDNFHQCYQTRHNRPTVNRELLVYHLLLVFFRWHEQTTN
jgi:hypothetical protein